jgi:hypothetical protein
MIISSAFVPVNLLQKLKIVFTKGCYSAINDLLIFPNFSCFSKYDPITLS